MDNPPEDDRVARVRQARQVLAGSDLHPPDDPVEFGHRSRIGVSRELSYLIVLGALVLLAALMWAILGTGPASAVLFLLGLALLAGWFVL